MHLRWLPAVLAVAAGLAALLAFPWSAAASIGVGVQASAVRLQGVAHPGANYALPPLFVTNSGTQPESISIQVERLSAGPGLTIPPAWIRIAALSGSLQPGQVARIALELRTPSGAKPGDYSSDIVATGSAGLAAGGLSLGAAAATKLEFTVAPGPAHRSWLSLPAWKWWMICALILLAAVVAGVRRAGLLTRIERRTL
jgi:hypothetical protein